jgi:thiamine monophosphate synthase
VRATPPLVVFTEHSLCADPERRLAPLLEASPAQNVLVLLRDKYLSARERLSLAGRISQVTERYEQCFGVVERLDLARAVGARFVHLPSNGVPSSRARELLPDVWLSRAFHDGDELTESDVSALDALIVSPVLAERKGRVALGAAYGDAIRARYPQLSRLALGGIAAETAQGLLADAWSGVVVQGAALVDDPIRLAHNLFG